MLRFLVPWCLCLFLRAVPAEALQPPNDPDFPNQWALSNQGQLIFGEPGTPGADVAAIAAWEAFEPSVPVVVAIVGTGVNPHPEFADRLLEGYVTSGAGGDPYSTLETVDFGTRVAGIIAASRNNGVGIAGLNDGAWILPVRALHGGAGTPESVAEGIEWAVDAGASVIVVPVQFYRGAEVLATALKYAAGRDVVVVAPTGHESDSTVAYPAGLDFCLGAASTDSQDRVAGFSNYGPQVDLAAPGVGIWSTNAEGGYGFESSAVSAWGAAYVAGVASLIRSQAPELERYIVEQILIESADDDSEHPGWDAQRGWGRINAAQALNQTLRPSIRFLHDEPQPSRIDPNLPTVLTVRVVPTAEEVVPGSVTTVIRYPGGQEGVHTMGALGGDRYGILLPPLECEESIEFYFRAEGSRGSIVSDPWHAPNERYAATAVRYRPLLDDDFESDQGWSAVAEGPSNTTGEWVRVAPVGTLAQPSYDFSPDFGRQCFVTGQHLGGNAGTNDVDWGPVRLVSPTMALGGSDVEVSYARWFYSEGVTTDALSIEFSRDGGGTWIAVETVTQTAPWEVHRFRLSEFPAVTGEALRLRFSTSDEPSDSLTEAAIDDVRVRSIRCSALRGDMDGDDDVDLADAKEWGSCLLGPGAVVGEGRCFRLDTDTDLDIDLRDLQTLQNQFGAS